MMSSLYECAIMHHRLEPVRNRFTYKVFMFYLDLDEIGPLARRLRLLSHNRFNYFSFRDSDHAQLTNASSLKESVLEYLKAKGVSLDGGKIMLLTNLRVLGYVFNPVSFYFCFNSAGRPACAVAEVNNTFGETKLFFIGRERFDGGSFRLRAEKHFYVSPFIDLDVSFDFNLTIPGDGLVIRINDCQDGRRILLSSIVGKRRELTNTNLAWYGLRYPLVTLKVIALIHWQALKLFLRGVHYHKKSANQDLQRDIHDGTTRA